MRNQHVGTVKTVVFLIIVSDEYSPPHPFTERIFFRWTAEVDAPPPRLRAGCLATAAVAAVFVCGLFVDIEQCAVERTVTSRGKDFVDEHPNSETDSKVSGDLRNRFIDTGALECRERTRGPGHKNIQTPRFATYRPLLVSVSARSPYHLDVVR